MTYHPVLDALRASGRISPDDLEFLRGHGRAYHGLTLPAGVRRRPPGSCFETADELEDLGRGRRIRGFALRPGSTKPLAHAWNSPDGRSAVDAVWTRAPDCSFWGISGREHEGRLIRMSRPFVSRPLFGLGVSLGL